MAKQASSTPGKPATAKVRKLTEESAEHVGTPEFLMNPDNVHFETALEQYAALQDLACQVDACRRLMESADFNDCVCEMEIAGARSILRAVSDRLNQLRSEFFVLFRDGSPEGQGGTR